MKNFIIIGIALIVFISLTNCGGGGGGGAGAPASTTNNPPPSGSRPSWQVATGLIVGILSTVSCPDSTHCFAASLSNGSNTGSSRIIKSTDMGHSWTGIFQENGTSARNWTEIYFSDSLNGSIVGAGVQHPMKTVDGGTTWTNITNLSVPYALVFNDANHGVYSGLYGANLTPPVSLSSSSDGGTTWVDTSITSSYSSTGYLPDFVFKKPVFVTSSTGSKTTTGFAVGQTGGGVYQHLLIKTTDGGATWTEIPTGYPTAISPRKTFSSIYFTDANHGWIGTLEGTILHTADGGTTWTTQTVNLSDSVNVVNCADSLHCLAITLGSLVYGSVDGGTTWTQQTMPTVTGVTAFSDIAFMDNLHGVLIGTSNGNEYVLYTLTGGF
jgi:photosystem II stability/assembly factor-like uncharacterized protein